MKIFHLGVLSLLQFICATTGFAPLQKGCNRLGSLRVASTDAPPLAPLTSWGDKYSDIRKIHEESCAKPVPEFAPEISAKDLGLSTEDEQLEYFKKNAMEIKKRMQAAGAVIFRDFALMKTQEGFQDFYNAIGMKVCLDPLHSVSARPTVDGSKNSPVYEAVNKESRKNFFIGMDA